MRLWGLPLAGHGDTRLYTLCRWLAVPLFGGLYRCRVEGTENLPREGAVIVITNHKSNIDPVIAGMICDRPLRYMAKKELFGNAALRKLIVTLGAFPIDRGAGDRAALTTSLEILADGGVLLMFPEGHRKPDDAVHEFLPGVGMLALRGGAPVVPLAMDGTQRMVARWAARAARFAGAHGAAARSQRPDGAQQQGLPGGGAAHARGRRRAVCAALTG